MTIWHESSHSRHGAWLIGLSSIRRSILLTGAALVLAACSSGDDNNVAARELTVSGVVQKGPLAAGSTGVVVGLGAGLDELGDSAASSITDVDRYAVRLSSSASFVEVTFVGRYFDELADADSAETVTLRALARTAPPQSEAQVNVNLVTTVIASRIAALLRQVPAAPDPFGQAEQEFRRAFDFASLRCAPGAFTELDYTGSSAADAYPLIASLVMLGARRDLGLSLDSLVSGLAADLADNGQLDDPGIRSALASAEAGLDVVAASDALRRRYQSAGRQVSIASAVPCANRTPVAAPVPEQVVIVGEPVWLDASASVDPDGDELVYTWSVIADQIDYLPGVGSSSSFFQRFNLSGVRVEVPQSAAGSFSVSLTVKDRFGASSQTSSRLIRRHTFQDNGNGTVTNLQTGLVWQLHDDGNRYTISEATGIGHIHPDDHHGINYCGNLVLGGFDDWRLPWVTEVMSTLDFSVSPLPVAQPLRDATRDDYLVSRSFRPLVSAFYVYMPTGKAQWVYAGGRYYVRCVRP